MIYYANPSTENVRKEMRRKRLGCIVTPAQGNRVEPGFLVCADNGCFGKGYPGDAKWLEWLKTLNPAQVSFATAPDVVGDAVGTLRKSLPHLQVIREMGIPASLVAQDGLEDLKVPWDEFDVLFIGGSTEWKLGPQAKELAGLANVRGKNVHMGRVNSFKRMSYAKQIGCTSVDGTFITFGPDVNLPKVLSWVERVNGWD